ncbi:hypothetical protein HYC85_021169 [Camellia sinensis]|uniref:SRP54-type proteins GTP-binding domain-containing protein n=1 Tax=Camellia sinensis TaxID=4442 RepID=A0A7J7GGW1_CAMSI|nr:hypothetical protein HYC85_021169 [Camellia sinensis]
MDELIVRSRIEEDNRKAEKRNEKNPIESKTNVVEQVHKPHNKKRKFSGDGLKQGDNNGNKKFKGKCYSCGKTGIEFLTTVALRRIAEVQARRLPIRPILRVALLYLQNLFRELCRMLDPGKPSFTSGKRKTSIILQGWKLALVCANTFRAGAFDQLKKNCAEARIPYHGRYCHYVYWRLYFPYTLDVQRYDATSDPVKIAVEGVEGSTKEFALFEEMQQVFGAMRPDLVVFVMDTCIGQAAFDQAEALKQNVSVGAVLSPVIFIGTGEHMDQLEEFDVKAYVCRLLGKRDWSFLVDEVREAVPVDQQIELLESPMKKILPSGNFKPSQKSVTSGLGAASLSSRSVRRTSPSERYPLGAILAEFSSVERSCKDVVEEEEEDGVDDEAGKQSMLELFFIAIEEEEEDI